MLLLTMNGNKFLGCSNYPACKNTGSYSIGVGCPNAGCGGSVVERKTRKGKTFYGCSKYPQCTFASWDKPVNKKCAKCGNPYMVQKEYKRRGSKIVTRCPACKAEADKA
jgi:DNA topoisomerase-1